MKMKTILPVVAVALCATVLGGCATTSKTPFGNYWNENALTAHESIHETLVYDVSFNKGTTYGYQLSYEDGKFTTVLQSSRDDKGETIYQYTSELSIKVVYQLGEERAEFSDSVKTDVKFRSADKGLTPISAAKTVVSYSPRAIRPTALENCYSKYEYSFTTTYEGDGGKTVLVRGDKTTEQTFDIHDDNCSYVDNEQLLLALRAMPASVTSTKLLAYSPFTASVQTVNVAFRTAAEGEFEFSKNGGEKTKQTIAYRPAQFQLDEKDSGFAQLVWIANSTDSAGKNAYRNVILRQESPLYHNLGVLVYTLSSVEYS